jgi:hypothetical protein
LLSASVNSIQNLRTALVYRKDVVRMGDPKNPMNLDLTDGRRLFLRALPFAFEGKSYPDQLIAETLALPREDRPLIARALLDHMPEPIGKRKRDRLLTAIPKRDQADYKK